MIDQVQYQAQVKSAKAAIEVAKSALNTQQLTVANKKELYKRQIISDFDLQTALDNLASCRAQLAQAKANLTNAEEQLSYCTVKSPADGSFTGASTFVFNLVDLNTYEIADETLNEHNK